MPIVENFVCASAVSHNHWISALVCQICFVSGQTFFEFCLLLMSISKHLMSTEWIDLVGVLVAGFLEDKNSFAVTARAARCLSHFDKYIADECFSASLHDACHHCSAPINCTVKHHHHLCLSGYSCIEYAGAAFVGATQPADAYTWIPAQEVLLCQVCANRPLHCIVGNVLNKHDDEDDGWRDGCWGRFHFYNMV